ncbi:FUSC family protein [Pseudomonas aeruginosa]|nr:FUSC family protein [Pseudomonas aeruginosa]
MAGRTRGTVARGPPGRVRGLPAALAPGAGRGARTVAPVPGLPRTPARRGEGGRAQRRGAGLWRAHPPGAGRHRLAPGHRARRAVRPAQRLAFLCVAAFWLASAWPSGLGAVSITGVVLSLFASRDNPAQAGLNFLRGILLSIPLAGFVALFYLPGVDGFPLLCLGLGVPLFFAALCVNRASLAGIASPFCIFFVKNVAPSNSMSYDLAHFLNNALSTVLGVAFAVLVFNLVSLRPGERHYRRMLQATLGDLARLTLRSPAQAEAWFGGRTADRLIRLAQRYDRLPEGRRQPWSDGLMGLDFGDELLYLRQCLEEVPASLAQARDRYLRRLRLALLGDGPRAEREHALDPPTARLLKALAASPLAGSERGELAGAALVQLQATWRQWCRSHAPAGTALRADPLPGAGR